MILQVGVLSTVKFNLDVNYWMNNLNEYAAENICKILIGNKLDAASEKREVVTEEG